MDGIGNLEKRINQGNSDLFFSISSDIEKYIVYKGSIAVNGISLTVASLKNNIFSVAVIPHTTKSTTLDSLKIWKAGKS